MRRRNGRHTDRATALAGERRGMSVTGFSREAALRDADRAWLDPALAATPAASRTLVHAPARAHDPDLDDGRPPRSGAPALFRRQSGAERRTTTSADPGDARGAGVTARRDRDVRIYLVAYEGTADDMAAWVSHYITHHTAIMTNFRHSRERKIGTRLDCRGALSGPHVNRMPRNKVAFNEPPGLRASLNSPVRRDMRANHATARKFTGPATHTPTHPAVVDLFRLAGAVAACQRGR